MLDVFTRHHSADVILRRRENCPKNARLFVGLVTRPRVDHRFSQSKLIPYMQKITPCLWFDDNAEEAVKFYTSLFKNSKILQVSHYGEAARVWLEGQKDRS